MVATIAETETISFARPAPLARRVATRADTPTEALEQFSQGVTLTERGEYEKAADAFERALRRSGDVPEAWYNRGTVLGYLGSYGEALHDLEQALRLRPDYFEAWHNKGVALGRLGRTQDAMGSFERALMLRPDDAQTWLSKSVILLAQHNLDQALVAVQQALAYNEDDAGIWLISGVTLAWLGEYAEAQRSFHTAFSLKDGSSNGPTFLYKAWATSTLALGVKALMSQDLSTFEQAGYGYIDIWEKAQQENVGQVVEEALTAFQLYLRKQRNRKYLMALEELELFIDLMKIKDPFEGWRALGRAISKRWPKGLSAVQAVREMRR